MWSHHFQNVKLERPFGYLTAEMSHQQIVVNKDKCLNCHNPPNIMDRTYDFFKEKGGQLTSKQIYEFWESQKKVRDENSSTTNIDCLTCHVKNNQVLVKEQISIQKNYGDFPHIAGETTIGKAENNCILCHDNLLITNFLLTRRATITVV